MRDQLKVQDLMDTHLNQRDEELCQIWSQSQADGAQLAALSLQVQELISLVETRAEVVGRDFEEINGQFDCHRGEVNHLKTREKNAKEKAEQLGGFIIGAAHEAKPSSLVLTGWQTTSAGVAILLQRLGRILYLWRRRLGWSCLMLLPKGVSTLLLLLRILSLSPSQLHATCVVCQLFFQPWKRLQKNLISSVMI